MTTKKFDFSVTTVAAMVLIIFCAIESTFSSPAERTDRLSTNIETVKVLYQTNSGKILTPYVFNFDIPELEAHESLAEAYLVLSFMEMTLEPLRGVTIKVYQVLDGKSPDNPNDHKLLDSEELPDTGVNSQKVFTVTDAVLDWMSGARNLGLLVTATDKNRENVEVEIAPSKNDDWTQPSLELLIKD